jgi:hypothetical protein
MIFLSVSVDREGIEKPQKTKQVRTEVGQYGRKMPQAGALFRSTLPGEPHLEPFSASGNCLARMIPIVASNAKLIDELNDRIVRFLQQTPAADVQRNLKATLAAAFGRLDLVTREEFDVQARVLARTREKLAALEAQVAELERRAQP